MSLELNKIYLGDAYELIKQIPDKSIDLILTDPPYGIGMGGGVKTRFGNSPESTRLYDNGEWDKQTPTKMLFDELLRAGKKVIIFGGNYFTHLLPNNNHWIVWDKVGEMQVKNPFSDCELIWTNIKRNNVKKYLVRSQGFIKDTRDERVHPTQKPSELIKMIIDDYSEPNDIILDPFMGSGTTAVACKELGRKYIGFEINKDYYEIASNRLKGISQQDIKDRNNGVMNLFEDFEI